MSNKQLPPAINLKGVKIICIDFTDSGVERTRIEINGHTFKRLYKDGHPIIWNDIYGDFNGCQAMTIKHEKEDIKNLYKTRSCCA